MNEVSLKVLAEYFKLENRTSRIALDPIFIDRNEINRPALQLAGFYQEFDNDRIQLLGKVELAYMQTKTEQQARQIWRTLFARHIPALIMCRGLECPAIMIEEAYLAGTPVLSTPEPTTQFMGRLITYLRTQLAPETSLHGVLVDVYGEGVLIMGDSGLGKSETALELVRRGHRLVADDVVEVHKVGDNELIGQSPEVLRHFVELRGIGIVNVKELYGAEAVIESQRIDMIIRLEPWNQETTYDRVGLENKTENILGNEVICYTIPIHPGRNLAVIIETATINHRSRKLGYNSAEALNEQIEKNLERRRRERERRQADEAFGRP